MGTFTRGKSSSPWPAESADGYPGATLCLHITLHLTWHCQAGCSHTTCILHQISSDTGSSTYAYESIHLVGSRSDREAKQWLMMMSWYMCMHVCVSSWSGGRRELVSEAVAGSSQHRMWISRTVENTLWPSVSCHRWRSHSSQFNTVNVVSLLSLRVCKQLNLYSALL